MVGGREPGSVVAIRAAAGGSNRQSGRWDESRVPPSSRRDVHCSPPETMAAGALPRSPAPGGLLASMLSGLLGGTSGSGNDVEDSPAATPMTDAGEDGDGRRDAASSKRSAEAYWRELLTKLRSPEAAEVRTFLQSRLRQFSRLNIDSLPTDGPESAPGVLQRLQSEVLLRMRRCAPWAEASEQEWMQTAEGLERFVMSQVHDLVLLGRSVDRDMDERVASRSDGLSTVVRPEHLGVPKSAVETLEFAEAWASAQDMLHRLAVYKVRSCRGVIMREWAAE